MYTLSSVMVSNAACADCIMFNARRISPLARRNSACFPSSVIETLDFRDVSYGMGRLLQHVTMNKIL
jgi:hypothetical protein